MPEKFAKLFIILPIFFVFAFSGAARAQQVADKTVATVSDSVTKPELITYSDLLWQLALQPGTQIKPPASEDLNRALQTLINQRLIALEANRLPSIAPTDVEIDAEIARLLSLFPSTADFVARLQSVGFDSVKDDNFRRIIRQRLAIEKYLDFRFRSFVVITPDDEEKYYRDVYVPDFRRKNPGLLVPSLAQKRAEINKILIETKIEEDIATYLDDAKRRAVVEVLFEV